MNSILVFAVDDSAFSVEALQRVFQSVAGFQDVRYNMAAGTPIEADYIQGGEDTVVRLSEDSQAISFSGASDAALRAALILQEHFQVPLRIIDTNYSFDLMLSDFKTVEQLNAAIQQAQQS